MRLSTYRPMLATPWPEPFSDDQWWFEPKWDGVRALLAWDGARPELRSRRGNVITHRYPELSRFRAARPCVIDGEIVALDERGLPSFELLQQRMNLERQPSAGPPPDPPIAFIAFDVLHDEGPVLTEPLEARRERLASLDPGEQLGRSEVVSGDGLALWEAVVERDLEGIVAKRLGTPYVPGARSRDWRKVHNVHTVRAVVGGFTPGSGGRSSTFGALLVGLWSGARLRWVGAVGTGFSDNDLREVRRALDEMTVDAVPFYADPGLPKGSTWVSPVLVAAIGHRDWTAAGRLRHPRFRGFTDDPSELITWEAEGPDPS